MDRVTALILALGIVLMSLIWGVFSRYEVSDVGPGAVAYRLDKLTGQVSFIRGRSISPVSQ